FWLSSPAAVRHSNRSNLVVRNHAPGKGEMFDQLILGHYTRAFELHASKSFSMKRIESEYLPCGSTRIFTPRSSAIRRGSKSLSRIRNRASLSVRLCPNSVFGSPSVLMTCFTPIVAAARTAFINCEVWYRQGADGSSRFAWAQYVLMVSPYLSNSRFRSNGFASRLASAVKPYSTPRQAPSELSVTSAYLKPMPLILSSCFSSVEMGSIRAKHPTFI